MMLIAWGWLLAVALVASPAAAQSCRPPPRGVETWNLALWKPVNQSSIYPSEHGGGPDKAVDGICNGNWYHFSCICTKHEQQPWWYVDLGHSYNISAVVVKNREDCCSELIRKAEIHLGDSLENHGRSNPLCGTILNTSPGSITTISCEGQPGRYVSVHLPGEGYLTICEVEVYGTR